MTQDQPHDGEERVLVSLGPCITQDPSEPAPQHYLDVCTGQAEHLATSTHCPASQCGGHLVCTPCYDLARQEGLVR